MWEQLLIRDLDRRLTAGGLRLSLPDGRRLDIGSGPDRIDLAMHDAALPRRLILNPDLALGEAYMDGALTLKDGDLRDLLNLAIGAAPAPLSPLAAMMALQRARLFWQGWNPIARARANAAHHYDISPELYGLFLGETRQYTCAYFRRPDMTLDQAQQAKMQHIAAKLRLSPGQSVLDIGCGFGTLALYLARHHGVRVLGVTLSQVQLEDARLRVAAAGLADRVEFRLQDYRQVEGRFDRIISVGMMEHVGRRQLGTYFAKVSGLLDPDGVALIHYIARPGRPEPNSPWFQRHIFPGSYCPALSEVTPHLARAGLILADLESWRGHYDPTLAAWRANFEANLDRIRALTDDRFLRMWRFYLTAAEVSFARGLLTIHQLQLCRAQGAVPPTRDYLCSDPAAERGNAGAGDLAQAQGAHQLGEGVDLLGRAGHFEDKAFQR